MNALVTGGAGFIGSNLVQKLIELGSDVRVLDDLSEGRRESVPAQAKLIVGDVADTSAVDEALDGVEIVFHQAAHRSVTRSVESPLTTDTANIHGTLTILERARAAGARRVIYASSSSVYGGAAEMPTPENAPTLPRSPYAVSKLAGEHYCRVYSEIFGLETVSLRYFNVYGPRQSPQSRYAAVIPLFLEALLRREAPTVHGDGHQSRDFSYVADVVEANLAAAGASAENVAGRAYNIAGGGRHSLLDLLALLQEITGIDCAPVHVEPRPGDVRHTQADITLAQRDLGFKPQTGFEEGLRATVEWFKRESS